MSLFNDKLKNISLKELLPLIIILFVIQYLFNSLNIVHIDTVWIYVFVIFFFVFKLKYEIPTLKVDVKELFLPKVIKTILMVVILNIFFSYGMLYFSEFVLNIVSDGNLFNSFLTTGLLATILVSPISEELIFRGVFLNRLKLIAHFLNNLFAEIILVCDSNKILFTNASVISVMSILAVVSFAILLVYIIRQLKVLNNDKL